MATSSEISITRYESGDSVVANDEIACEEPLEIRVEGKSVAIVMRTPGHDEELTAGFLLSEGIVAGRGEIFEISQCPSQEGQQGNVIEVLLTDASRLDLAALTRNVFTSSSCGICGKATIESVFQQFPPLGGDYGVAAEMILHYPDRLRSAQSTFDRTGGLHASALIDAAGEILVVREDVGRHNALDKVIGYALLNDLLPLSEYSLILSGRISFELVQKALSAGIPIVAGISAPSSLAVEFARESGQALIGFLRGQSMNIYAGTGRISTDEKA
ncbi:MAG: formate dehydrogenase accessory sulfurtransferase FdhD [Verrucomicrobiales bacterium]